MTTILAETRVATPCECHRVVSQPENAKKIHKNLYFGFQGHPRSLFRVAI